MPAKLEIAPGTRFGRLTVIREVPVADRPVKTNRYFECACDCGGASKSPLCGLRTGSARSCGCFRRDSTISCNSKHGEAGKNSTAEYRAWKAMHDRCRSNNVVMRSSYGDRGVTVCERWASFPHFLSDMGRRPSRRHSVDRIDVDKGYGPDNCRWATYEQQARNRRSNKLTFDQAVAVARAVLNGETCPKVAKRFGVSRGMPLAIVKGNCWKDALDAAQHTNKSAFQREWGL